MRTRLLLSLLVGLVLAGCSAKPEKTARKAEQQDGPPLVVPAGLADLPDPEVRHERPTKRGNPKSYTVFGKTYHVMNSAAGYDAVGNASWYGRKFHGRKTSNGETYNMWSGTAAHKTLPIPCYALVTNLDNGRKVVVRINDRGPFHADRLIDLAEEAVELLGGAPQIRVRPRLGNVEPHQVRVALRMHAGGHVDEDRARLAASRSRRPRLPGERDSIIRPTL